ncbi:MAG: 3-phosphoserine/phosphohydroxythreonine transaminase, partial [Pseudomonadota bacterium]
GGGLAENAIVPLNLSRGGEVDFIVSGAWSAKSAKEAQRYCTAHIAASNAEGGHVAWPAPATWQLSRQPAYVHLCSNETIHGVEVKELPDLLALGCDAPLVIDCSSHILSRPIDWSRVGLAFAGAQKNIGPAGVTLVIVREDLLGQALAACPSAFNYQLVADNASMYNTPPTYGIYIAGLVFQWIERQGGVAEMERRAVAKAELLYGALEGLAPFYRVAVQAGSRSRMNVPFYLADETLNEAFLAQARERGLLQLKGHKSVGGMRASIYNAMPLAGVQALVDHLTDFARRHG